MDGRGDRLIAGPDDDALASVTLTFGLCPSSMGIPIEAWAERVGGSPDALTPEEQRTVLQEVVNEIAVDRENNLVITIAIPVEQDETQVASQESR